MIKSKLVTESTDKGGSSQSAAQELLHNGILVETNKGLICMSLKDALNEGVGGVSISEEDFKNVAAKLLAFQDTEPDKNANDPFEFNNVLKDPVTSTSPFKTIKAIPQRRSLSKVSHKIATCTSTETPGPSSSGDLFDSSNFIFENDDLDSVLVSDSGLSSDTSEIFSASNASSDTALPKKRGGWPKGRKRKPDNKWEVRPPKAPATGYVLFLNEKRKDYKYTNLRFTEVTKILGNIWSGLSTLEKRKYLDQAEVEKKRYREELKAFRQSDTYRQYLLRKKSKRTLADGTEESDMDATDEIDEEDDGEELYCRPCNQYFHSLHNKKEHMYGRQHLAGIASSGRCDWPVSTSLDESSQDGARDDSAATHAKERVTNFISMDEAMVRVTSSVLQREREINVLKSKLNYEITERKQTLQKTLSTQKKKVEMGFKNKEQELKRTEIIEQQLLNLMRVPTLFGEYSPI